MGPLPAPPRTPGGYRDYPEQTKARLGFIRDAQGAGLSLSEIRSVLTLRDGGQTPCAHVTVLIDQHLTDIERRLAELTATREALRGLARRAAATDPAAGTADDICNFLPPTNTRAMLVDSPPLR
ncbi:MerR family DNA-binding protein [Streptomyces cinerochromogenes]|uniref:MerR family DNA-binding protein n=1 Tax=Streptomyces cinerochromogenes TaxID=66422 RepID=A0ABW7BHW8_9ACTN